MLLYYSSARRSRPDDNRDVDVQYRHRVRTQRTRMSLRASSNRHARLTAEIQHRSVSQPRPPFVSLFVPFAPLYALSHRWPKPAGLSQIAFRPFKLIGRLLITKLFWLPTLAPTLYLKRYLAPQKQSRHYESFGTHRTNCLRDGGHSWRRNCTPAETPAPQIARRYLSHTSWARYPYTPEPTLRVGKFAPRISAH